MSDKLPTVNRIKAIDMVANLSVDDLSPEDRLSIEDAIEADLDAESVHVADDEARLTNLEDQMHALSDAIAEPAIVIENRLAQVEKQTHGLAEAVIAITETADTLAPAVRAVKDEMTGATPVPEPRAPEVVLAERAAAHQFTALLDAIAQGYGPCCKDARRQRGHGGGNSGLTKGDHVPEGLPRRRSSCGVSGRESVCLRCVAVYLWNGIDLRLMEDDEFLTHRTDPGKTVVAHSCRGMAGEAGGERTGQSV